MDEQTSKLMQQHINIAYMYNNPQLYRMKSCKNKNKWDYVNLNIDKC